MLRKSTSLAHPKIENNYPIQVHDATLHALQPKAIFREANIVREADEGEEGVSDVRRLKNKKGQGLDNVGPEAVVGVNGALRMGVVERMRVRNQAEITGASRW
jgi:hypothetical protein